MMMKDEAEEYLIVKETPKSLSISSGHQNNTKQQHKRKKDCILHHARECPTIKAKKEFNSDKTKSKKKKDGPFAFLFPSLPYYFNPNFLSLSG